jgi:ComF family protein
VVLYNKIKDLVKVAAKIGDAVLPARCPISGAVVDQPGLVAPSVWGKLDFIERPFCAKCSLRFEVPAEADDICPACLVDPPAFTAARAVVAYDGHSREMILAFKHGDQTHLTTTFGPWLTRAAEEWRNQVDMIIPVPLHRLRLWRRRYNQAGLLARDMAARWDIPFRPDILARRRATVSQGHMTVQQRLDNVSGAFAVANAAAVRDQVVLLVDDVYTTGATVKACAMVLRRAGAHAVYVVTLARVIRSVVVDKD